jgi:hypothetical protein
MAAAGLATDDDFGTRVRRDAAEIARRHAAPDAPGRFIVAGCALVLASFQEMVAGGVSREDAYEVVRRAVLASYRGPMTLVGRGYRLVFWFSRDPVRALDRLTPRAIRWGPRVFGQAMTFDSSVDEGRVEWHVTRCPFHDFYVAEGEPLLTRVFSQLDLLWMEEASRSRRPIGAERPETLSTGGERCRFCFVRTADSGAPVPDIVRDQWSEVRIELRNQGGGVA